MVNEIYNFLRSCDRLTLSHRMLSNVDYDAESWAHNRIQSNIWKVNKNNPHCEINQNTAHTTAHI